MYILLVKEPGCEEWSPVLEDSDLAVVKDQLRCDQANVGYGYGFVKGTKFKIIETA